MTGLLRTTSRSESSNFLFQHFHETGDMLVEFYSNFESVMDKQRLHYVEDKKKSEQIPLADTAMSIEKDASKLYTLEIYYLFKEEIKTPCLHTTMADMTRDNESSCKVFFRKGYLCRHAFAVLHQCSVKQILEGFVKPRWSKNAVKRHSFLGSSQVKDICETWDRKKLKRTRAWFEFHNCMNIAGENEDKLDSVIKGIQSINDALTQSSDNTPVVEGSHRADKFIDHPPESEISVLNPNISRNKGCGSQIKSSREIASEMVMGRHCSKCNQSGHNAHTCKGKKGSS
ncbi:hypothetical protein POM88_041293 [Heracleum sosnowskyi]|uniref:Protein FAR1-RELATED SEQUENCE n=1 Tax=Heracleum sosnowskyi TaxID=360622 RepID=A0AAD8MAL3_9APIA|nr:hypothetical protein POM88_041293 [Heracleum sosnowskyi]